MNLSIHLRKMLLKKHLLDHLVDIPGRKHHGEIVMHHVVVEPEQGKYFALQLIHLNGLMLASVILTSDHLTMRRVMLLLANRGGMLEMMS